MKDSQLLRGFAHHALVDNGVAAIDRLSLVDGVFIARSVPLSQSDKSVIGAPARFFCWRA